MSQFFAGSKESIAAQFTNHRSLSYLWEFEWKIKCQRTISPFNEGALVSDFSPVFQRLIEKGINDPFDDQWLLEFVPSIFQLLFEADAIKELAGADAATLYLRAAALCRIARFPIINSLPREIIWYIQQLAYSAAIQSTINPMQFISITHRYAAAGDAFVIPLSYKLPSQAKYAERVPVMVCIDGHDGSRIDFPVRCTDYFTARGWAIIGVEMPGCGDCSASKTDAQSPDRLWDSLLDWIQAQPELDEHNVCVWGLSTGAYYSLRAAHTHSQRLKGAIAQGLWAHHALSPEWIDIMDCGEYPLTLARSLMHKFGFENLEEMKMNAQKQFSLIESGVLEKPCTRLLLLNGANDTVYPIEDSILALQYGGPKEARFLQSHGHLGEPEAGRIGIAWTKHLFESPQYSIPEAFAIYRHAIRLRIQRNSIRTREEHDLAVTSAHMPNGSRRSFSETANGTIVNAADTPDKFLVRRSRPSRISSTGSRRASVNKREQDNGATLVDWQCQSTTEEALENYQGPSVPIQDSFRASLPLSAEEQLLISQKAMILEAMNASVEEIRALRTAITHESRNPQHDSDCDVERSPSLSSQLSNDQDSSKAGSGPLLHCASDPGISRGRNSSITTINTNRSISEDAAEQF